MLHNKLKFNHPLAILRNNSKIWLIMAMILVPIYGFLGANIGNSSFSGNIITFMFFLALITMFMIHTTKINLLSKGILTLHFMIPWEKIQKYDLTAPTVEGFELLKVYKITLYINTRNKFLKEKNIYLHKEDIQTFTSIVDEHIRSIK